MDRVAAEIALEILTRLQQDHGNSGTCKEEREQHACRAASDYAATRLRRFPREFCSGCVCHFFFSESDRGAPGWSRQEPVAYTDAACLRAYRFFRMTRML